MKAAISMLTLATMQSQSPYLDSQALLSTISYFFVTSSWISSILSSFSAYITAAFSEGVAKSYIIHNSI